MSTLFLTDLEALKTNICTYITQVRHAPRSRTLFDGPNFEKGLLLFDKVFPWGDSSADARYKKHATSHFKLIFFMFFNTSPLPQSIF